MDILIVEDEPHAVTRLQKLLTALVPECRIVGVTDSIESTVQWLAAHPTPDLVMMDINLSDGSCFSLFEVCDITAPIIFCTAYDEYALKAFQSNGIAYLLKPVTKADLLGALQKLEQLRTAFRPDGQERRKFYRNLNPHTPEYKTRFLIKAGEKLLPVLVHDIAGFIMQEHGLKVHLQNGSDYFLDFSLTELEDILDPAHFFRISRQAIVSKASIASAKTKLRKAKVNIDTLDIDLPIARERVKSFRQWLER